MPKQALTVQQRSWSSDSHPVQEGVCRAYVPTPLPAPTCMWFGIDELCWDPSLMQSSQAALLAAGELGLLFSSLLGPDGR